MNKTGERSGRKWFGLTRGQFMWAVAVRVIVAIVVGSAVYIATSSVVWLIVALLLSSVIVNAASSAPHRR